MALARTIWRILVGIKDGLALLFLLLFFAMVWAVLSFGDAPEVIHEGVLDLTLNGTVVEQPSRAGLAEHLAGNAPAQIRARDIIVALRSAAGDDRIKAVSLDLDSFGGAGQVVAQDVGAALAEVREAGKPVLAYATYYTDDSYLIAAHASEIWLSPMGGVILRGQGYSTLYLKDLADRLGVTMNVYKVGTYKAAIEPLTRNSMSEPARENANALAGALAEQYSETLASARPKAAKGAQAMMMQPVETLAAANGDFAKAALAAKLVDKVATKSAYHDRLVELGGAADEYRAEEIFRRVDLTDYANEAYAGDEGGAIALVTVAGNIVDGEAGPGNAGGDSIAALIREAANDDSIEALVLRVDSPGGSAMASEVIRDALLDFKGDGKDARPVVISMGNVAASGGYWIATPGDKIIAEPSTITGSIGVFGVVPSFEKSLAKVGVASDGVATAPLAGQPDLFGGINAPTNAILQAGVEATYRDFLARVAKSRGKTPAEIDRVAQGRVWDGGTARQLGLVDSFGDLDNAVSMAATLAKLDSEKAAIVYFDPPMTAADRLVELLAAEEGRSAASHDVFSALSGSPTALFARAYAELRAVVDGPSIQARCLDCPTLTIKGPAIKAERDGLWTWLLSRLG